MDFHLPELGEGVYEAELVSWHVKPGDLVKPGQSLMEVLTDKATMDVPAPFAGSIQSLGAEAGQQLKVGAVVLTYAPAGAGPSPPGPPKVNQAAAALPAAGSKVQESPGSLAVKAAPSVRLMAQKLGLDLARIQGSGPRGRVLIEDLVRPTPTARAPETKSSRQVSVDFGQPGTRLKLQGVRRKMAEHMAQSARTLAHSTYVDECEVTDLVRLRLGLRDQFVRKGLRLTYMPFFVQAIVGALREVPIVNATLDEGAGEIVLHDRYHIGLAMATPSGLVVPVVRDADRKNLAELARDIDRLTNEARAGKIRLEDLRGGTFTLTSVGSLGGLFATPIINAPEVAILGIGKIVKRPVFDEHGQIRPADMVYLSLTFDHRLLDGATAAAFSKAVSQRLTNPATLLVDL